MTLRGWGPYANDSAFHAKKRQFPSEKNKRGNCLTNQGILELIVQGSSFNKKPPLRNSCFAGAGDSVSKVTELKLRATAPCYGSVLRLAVDVHLRVGDGDAVFVEGDFDVPDQVEIDGPVVLRCAPDPYGVFQRGILMRG